MNFFYRVALCICTVLLPSMTCTMENAPPYHPKVLSSAAVDCGTTVGSSAEFRWSPDLASATTPSTPQVEYNQNTGTVSFPGDISSISLHDNPCGPGPGGARPQLADPRYMYRAIDLDDSGSKALLTDQEMQEIHALYLEGTNGSIQRIELKRDILHRKLHHHHSVVGDYACRLDLTRSAKLRRLSFMNRVMRHHQQQKEANRPPDPGTIQTEPRSGQTLREFSGTASMLRPMSNLAGTIKRARALPLGPYLSKIATDFDHLNALQSDATIKGEFQRQVTADPKTDIDAFMKQVNGLLDDLEGRGVITGRTALFFAKEFAEGVGEYAAYIKDNPREWASEFVNGNVEMVKQLALLLVDAHSAPEGLYGNEREMALFEQRVQERMESATQLYNQLGEHLSQMSRKEWAKLSSRIFVDYCAFKAIDLGVTSLRSIKLPARIAANPLFEQLEQELGIFSARHPELTTPEGITLTLPKSAEGETSLLKHAAEKQRGSSAQELVKDVARVERVANMGQVFEKSGFGQTLKKSSVKTKFQCRKTGAQVYKVTEKIPEYGLKKGDQLCLDTLHFDHIEVYNKGDDVIFVLNLDGSVNSDKQAKVLRQARVLHKK